jgi:hypothetical protein
LEPSYGDVPNFDFAADYFVLLFPKIFCGRDCHQRPERLNYDKRGGLEMANSCTANKPIALRPYLELDMGQKLQNFRTVPLSLGTGNVKAFLSVYSANYDIDASYEMFCYPTDTFKMMVYTAKGEILWRRDLGGGVCPGTAFSTFYAFDLDQDGVDEIWLVNNLDPIHPFNYNQFVLERVDALTGVTTGQWPWPKTDINQYFGEFFRCHIFGAYVKDEPVLLTVQGTYGLMQFQAWKPDLTLRWAKTITKEEAGARGGHNYPVLDINNDGIDEFLWGERCIEVNTGCEIFCADRATWRGHSDMVQPFPDPATGRWLFWVIRESFEELAPRIILYNDRGERVWSALDYGHIHKGWVGRIGAQGGLIATAVRIESQTKTLEGRYYTGISEFAFDALTGEPVKLSFSIADTAPVDLNGDGRHEIVSGMIGGDAEVIDRKGNLIQKIGGRVALCSKIVDHPGEQLLTYYPDGNIKIWVDGNAVDSPAALKRYANRFYVVNRRFPTKESIMCILGGI